MSVEAQTGDVVLVQRATEGDRDAFAALYDRFSPQVYGLCCRMLRDHHEAADVTAEVFLIAAERLRQLRDPAKVRAWLLAVARNESHRVLRDRKRVTPDHRIDLLASAAPLDGFSDESLASDPDAAQALLTAAADGLDDRDRAILALSLAGLGGDDLGAALGVTPTNAYQLVHRMRERLERTVVALYVSRAGRSDCEELDRIVASWAGGFTPRRRKQLARHVDGCETCERHRRKAPAAVLSGTALAAGAPIAALVPPPGIRELVLAGYPERSARRSRSWGRGGWPPPIGAARHRRAAISAATAIAILLLVGGVISLGEGSDQQVVAEGASERGTTIPGTGSTSTTATSTTDAPTTSTVVPPSTGPVPDVAGETTVPTPETTALSPTPTPAPIALPPTPTPSPDPTMSGVTHPTAPPDLTGPTVTLSGPTMLVWKECLVQPNTNAPYSSSASDRSGIVAVDLLWKTNGAEQVAAMTFDGSTWNASIEPPYVPVPVTIRARARDGAGNIAYSSTLVVPAVCPPF